MAVKRASHSVERDAHQHITDRGRTVAVTVPRSADPGRPETCSLAVSTGDGETTIPQREPGGPPRTAARLQAPRRNLMHDA
ncbi:hypothetical protein BD414DRAFT_499594 [Trametes punicea]|nr:hypothetical protein BD414DRAFT_499594 [Trametes punicea]